MVKSRNKVKRTRRVRSQKVRGTKKVKKTSKRTFKKRSYKNKKRRSKKLFGGSLPDEIRLRRLASAQARDRQNREEIQLVETLYNSAISSPRADLVFIPRSFKVSGEWKPFKLGLEEIFLNTIQKNPEFLRNIFALRASVIATAKLQDFVPFILKFFNENISRFMQRASSLNYKLMELTFLKFQEKQNKTPAILTGIGPFAQLLSTKQSSEYLNALNEYSPSLKTSCTLIDFFLKVLEHRGRPRGYRPGITSEFYEKEQGGTSGDTVKEIIEFFDEQIRKRESRKSSGYLMGVSKSNIPDLPNTLCTQADLTKGLNYRNELIQDYISGESSEEDAPRGSENLERQMSTLERLSIDSGKEAPEIPLNYVPFSLDTLKEQLKQTPCVSLPPQPNQNRSVDYGGFFGGDSREARVGVPLISGANLFDVNNHGVSFDFPCAGISGHTVEIALFYRLLLGNNYSTITPASKLNLTKYIIIACLNWMVSYVHHSFREICLAALIPLWNCQDTDQGFVDLKNSILILFKKLGSQGRYLRPENLPRQFAASWFQTQYTAFENVRKLLVPETSFFNINFDDNYIEQLLRNTPNTEIERIKSEILTDYKSWLEFIEANRGPNGMYAF